MRKKVYMKKGSIMKKKKLALLLIPLILIIVVRGYGIVSIISSGTSGNKNQANISGGQIKENTLNNDVDNNNFDSDKKNIENGTGNSNEKNLEKKTNTNKDKRLVLHMPDIFYDRRQWLKFSKLLEREHGIKLEIKKHSYHKYEKEIKQNTVSSKTGDLFIVSNNQLKNNKDNIKNINLENKDRLTSQFHYLFVDNFNSESGTFLPYMIDPMVTWVRNDEYWSDIDIIEIEELQNFISQQRNKASFKYSIPFVFGVDDITINLLSRNRKVYNHFITFLYHMIYNSILDQDLDIIRFIINVSNKGNFSGWDYKKYRLITEKLSNKNSNCNNYRRLCLLASGYGQVGMGYMTDKLIMEKYLDNFNIKQLEQYPILFGTRGDYPSKTRGIVANSKSSKDKLIKTFVEFYINLLNDEENNLFWKDSLSPFNSLYEKQIINSKYNFMSPYRNTLMSYDSIDKQKFIQNTKILDVLRGNFSIKAFLENMELKF